MMTKGTCIHFDLRVPVKNFGKAADINLQTIIFMNFHMSKLYVQFTHLLDTLKSQFYGEKRHLC